MSKKSARKFLTESGHDIFSDPAIAQASKEDPIAQFISLYWRKLLAVVVAAGLITWGINTYYSVNEQKKAAATQLFGSVREQYELFISEQEKVTGLRAQLISAESSKKEDLNKQLEASEKDLQAYRDRGLKMIESLKDADVEPFPQLATLFANLFALKSGEAKTLASGPADEWMSSGSPGSAKREVSELSALLVARSMLDDGKTEAQAKTYLQQLAESGTVARVSAALTLGRIAETPEEKRQAKDLLQKIKVDQPEQSKFVDPVLKDLD